MDEKLILAGLFCLGLATSYGGFLLGGRLFDRRRDISAIAVAGLLIPGGAGLSALAATVLLSY